MGFGLVSGIFAEPVRIILLFRLVPSITCSTCPNHPVIPTGPSDYLINLSESPCYSDWSLRLHTQPVRITLLFRLVPPITYSTCPNHPAIPTGPSDYMLNLSDSPCYSDWSLRLQAQPVPITLLFRLVPSITCSTCPNRPRTAR
ncbi:hypothetical protein J2Z26_003438 [Bacillus luteolus]|nr:hypothetical protein [Cytobacillus luteolus]